MTDPWLTANRSMNSRFALFRSSRVSAVYTHWAALRDFGARRFSDERKFSILFGFPLFRRFLSPLRCWRLAHCQTLAVCALFASDARSVRRSHKLNKSPHKIFIVERNLRTFAYMPPFFLYYYFRTVLENQMKLSSEINTCTLTSCSHIQHEREGKIGFRSRNLPLSLLPHTFSISI